MSYSRSSATLRKANPFRKPKLRQSEPIQQSHYRGFRQFWSVCCLAALGLVPMALQPQRAWSAAQVQVTYGLLEFPIALEDLEIFAETGRITGGLRLYARFLDEQQEANLREFLQQKYDISPVVISQVTYSPIGEQILQNLGQIIQTDARVDGFYALRSALILAAADPEGFSMINVIRFFPSRNIRIQGGELLELQRQFNILVSYRDAAIESIQQEAQTEIAAAPLALPQPDSEQPNLVNNPDQSDTEQSNSEQSNSEEPIPEPSDLEQPGPFQVETQTFTLNRDRQTLQGTRIERRFTVDLYLPKGTTQPAPVVVISHGLGSSPAGFIYLGEHLASHGFAAVVVQHLGSDVSRQEALLSGILSSNVNPVDFIDRPLDITYTLDQLESRAQTDPALAGRMNLQQVGIIGHSFGGYTALSLAGADLNIERIQQDCPTRLNTNFNAAPILQCLADRLPNLSYSLQDERVRAVFAISPINSIVLGPESLRQIQVPTMMMGGSNDYVASVVQEQIHPFLWLTTPEKYLVLSIPSGHTYADATEEEQAIALPENLDALLAGPAPELARQYVKALSVAFMQTHLANQPAYQAYLTSAYTQSISRSPLQLTLIRSLTAEQLEQTYGRRPPIPIEPPLATQPIPQRSRLILEEIAATGVLRVGIRQDAAPFGSVGANGQTVGFCVDAMNSLATELEQQLDRPVRMEITAQSTVANRFQIVRDNVVQIECGPNTIRPELAEVNFSTPFFVTGTHFLVSTANPTPINPFNTLSGTRIGVLQDTTTETFVRDRYTTAEIIPFAGVTGRAAGIQAVIDGNIDAFAGDGILSIAEAQRQNIPANRYTLVPDSPLTCDPYGMVLPANDRQWQDTVNDFIASPTFRQLWETQFTTDLTSYIFLNLDFCATDRADRESLRIRPES